MDALSALAQITAHNNAVNPMTVAELRSLAAILHTQTYQRAVYAANQLRSVDK